MHKNSAEMRKNMNINFKVRELLIRVEYARKQIIGPYLTNLGLTPGQGQARILNFLLEQDHVTQKELADMCKVDVTTMSRNLDKLEYMGFLNRQTNPTCRRSFLICLSEIGRAKAEKVHNLLENMDITLFNGIDETEIQSFYKTLEKICGNLENAKK